MLAQDEQFALLAPGEHEQVRATVDPHRDAQDDTPAGRDHRPAGLQRGAHAVCGAAGPLGVIVALEEQEQRVAAELDEIATLAASDTQEGVESGVQDESELLGARPSELGEPFRQLGEARDVGEHEGALCQPRGPITRAE